MSFCFYGELTMQRNINIPIGGFKDVYRASDVENALVDLAPNANEALRTTYEKMLRTGSARFCVKPSQMPNMDQLYEEHPNFVEVLDDIRKQLILCMETDDPLELTPMLLLGEPGIGKTHFARRLANILGTSFEFVSMSSLTAGWVLSGSSSQWKNAKAGKVFETLVNGSFANPLMVVDEIDKASNDNQYDPLGALYSLLEHDTAAEFVDEFAEIPLDTTDIIWVATANELRNIPEPILNRMNVYHIPTPDFEAACIISQTIYAEIRNSHHWGEVFPEMLDQATREKLGKCSPREMRRLILGGFGNAKLEQRNQITPDDITTERGCKKQRIGF